MVRPAGVIDDLVDEIPLLLRARSRTPAGRRSPSSVSVRTWGFALSASFQSANERYSICREPLLAADGAEQVPAVLEADDRRVLDAVAGVVGTRGGATKGPVAYPAEPAREQLLDRRRPSGLEVRAVLGGCDARQPDDGQQGCESAPHRPPPPFAGHRGPRAPEPPPRSGPAPGPALGNALSPSSQVEGGCRRGRPLGRNGSVS